MIDKKRTEAKEQEKEIVEKTEKEIAEKIANEEKKKEKAIGKAEKKEEKKEKEIVEKVVKKVEKRKEKVEEAEKEIAEKISEEEEKLEKVKEKTEEDEEEEDEEIVEEALKEIGEKNEKPKEKIKKTEKKFGLKKTEAKVNGRDLRISTKQAVAVCDFIRNKDIELAIANLEKVSKIKLAIPMRGEIPHREGNIMSGRYPVKAVNEFIRLLKSLKANAIVNELELEKMKLSCVANIASRPYKRFGNRKFKRTHLEIKLIPRIEK